MHLFNVDKIEQRVAELSDRNIPVNYDDAQHKYSLNGTTYTSATQLLEHFKRPFDVEERSVYMAGKYGHTPQYWKDKWRSGNRKSLVRGNDLHDDQEQSLYKQKFVDYNPVPLTVFDPSIALKSGLPFISLVDGVYPEMKLWRHDHRIAGRSDKVILRTGIVAPDGDVWPLCRIADIEDYKTNKKIQKYGFQDKYGITQKMLDPISHIEDAEYWHYALQLSIYQFMLEYHGFYPGKRRIIHFPHPTDEFPDPKPVTYELPYLRKEVVAMLYHYETKIAV